MYKTAIEVNATEEMVNNVGRDGASELNIFKTEFNGTCLSQLVP